MSKSTEAEKKEAKSFKVSYFSCWNWCCSVLVEFSFCVCLAVACLGVLAMLVALIVFIHLHWTTRLLVFVDTFWKVGFYIFGLIGILTVASTFVHDNDNPDSIQRFWQFQYSILDIKSWQPRGFILQPLGLYFLGGFLFVTQVLLEEQILPGEEVLKSESEEKRCFFLEQVDWQVAATIPHVHRGTVPNATSLRAPWVPTHTCGLSRECKLKEAKIEYEVRRTSTWMQYWSALWGQWIRRVPPSTCFMANETLPALALNLPMKDFSPAEVKNSTKNLRFAPAYMGADGPPWNRSQFFAKDYWTACNYECYEWGEGSAVENLLECGMVIGGGLTIVLVANAVGNYVGNSFVTHDTKPEELINVLLRDVRVLFRARKRLFESLCCQKMGNHATGKAFRHFTKLAWQGVIINIVKLILYFYCGTKIYRHVAVRYTGSLSDRGLLRCILYLSIFNSGLRSIFCFTRKCWREGEDDGFYPLTGMKASNSTGARGCLRGCEMPGDSSAPELRRMQTVQLAEGEDEGSSGSMVSYDLYEWMKAPGYKVAPLLFGYIRRIGKEELADPDREVRIKVMRTIRLEGKDWGLCVEKNKEGIIKKPEGHGAQWRGTSILVEFEEGVTTDPHILKQMGQHEEAPGSESRAQVVAVDPADLIQVHVPDKDSSEVSSCFGLSCSAEAEIMTQKNFLEWLEGNSNMQEDEEACPFLGPCMEIDSEDGSMHFLCAARARQFHREDHEQARPSPLTPTPISTSSILHKPHTLDPKPHMLLAPPVAVCRSD
eukprot:s1773_g13.t2